MRDDRLRVVLDTNILLVSVSSRSSYHWIFQALLKERFILLLSNEILSEYEEILSEKWSIEVAKATLRTLLLLPDAEWIHPSYHWRLIIDDPDDDKFVDCAVAGNAHVLVSHDKHFSVLDAIDFPKLHVVDIPTFQAMLDSDLSS